jgi:hypothetical protein
LVRGKTERSTGTELAIPVDTKLREIIDATPSGHLIFLVTEFGKPVAVARFGSWFREQCDMANLQLCVFTACARLHQLGLRETDVGRTRLRRSPVT